MPKNKTIKWDALIISIGLALAIGFIGSLVTAPNIPTWYISLNKPFFNPPNWLFGPVWTTLYILMGISAYLVFAKYDHRSIAHVFYRLYIVQLVLNSLWSFVFFGFKNPGLALIVIACLLFEIVKLTLEARRIRLPIASYLLYPYIAWVSFATLLNLAIYLLN